MATQMNSFVALVISFNPNPKPTISSCKLITLQATLPGNGTNFYGQKLQTTHFYKGPPLQHNMRTEKMITITARTRDPPHFTFPTFSDGKIHLSKDFTKLRSDGTLFFQNLDSGHGSQRPSTDQKVVVICTIYNERREVKGTEDEKITLVMGDNTNQLGKGFDIAIRNMGVNGRAIFVIHKNLWPTGSRKPKTGFGSKQKYIVCDVTLVKILG
ncbi:uncharacterized protein LOC133790133 isoform X2 [Humulus lupulus]|uniref:uncharacterized protein LOC133790133 isoform X2 n=1 Tax=Humulus lupulus TaxID=3486 RepID=UPI002B4068BC|nr:uncharacterized protein LOC133790133 isoform X2 [Humulus lupulus]